MRKLILGLVMLFGIAIMPSTAFAQVKTTQTVSDEIIALVKAQWAAGIADPGNVTEAYKNISDDYTEFNGEYSTRIDGKATSMKFAEAGAKDPSRTVVAEMLNPKVQVYGDVAILSYNYAGISKDKDGVTDPVRAKSTRVYAKQDGKWKLVHANFAMDPKP